MITTEQDSITGSQALVSGAAGAIALTLAHETARQLIPQAPRVDVLGMRAIAAGMRAIGQQPPSHDGLYWLSLAGDLVSNGLYYSLVARGDRSGAWRRGVALGLAAGLGAVLLPAPLGLGRSPTGRAPITAALTIAWYLLGGLVAAAVARRQS